MRLFLASALLLVGAMVTETLAVPVARPKPANSLAKIIQSRQTSKEKIKANGRKRQVGSASSKGSSSASPSTSKGRTTMTPSKWLKYCGDTLAGTSHAFYAKVDDDSKYNSEYLAVDQTKGVLDWKSDNAAYLYLDSECHLVYLKQNAMAGYETKNGHDELCFQTPEEIDNKGGDSTFDALTCHVHDSVLTCTSDALDGKDGSFTVEAKAEHKAAVVFGSASSQHADSTWSPTISFSIWKDN